MSVLKVQLSLLLLLLELVFGHEIRGNVLRVVVPDELSNYPEVLTENVTGTLVLKSGLSVDIIKYLEDSLGISTSVVINNSWPSFVDGNWTGMGDVVYSGEADVAIVGIAFTPGRRSSFDFLLPHLEAEISAYFRQPSLSTIRNHFTYVFSTQLWIATFTMLIIFILLLFLFQIFILKLPVSNLSNDSDEVGRVKVECSRIILTVLSAFTQQGWYGQPNRTHLKIIWFSACTLFSFLFTYYTSALLSALTVQDIPIKDSFDLLQSSLKLLAEKGNSAIDILLKSGIYEENGSSDDYDSQTLKTLISRSKSDSSMFVNYDVGAQMTLDGNGAFLMSGLDFYSVLHAMHVTPLEICSKISHVPLTSNYQKMGMILRQNSGYKEPFAIKMIEMWEHGLLPLYKSRYNTNVKPKCESISDSPVLEFMDLFAAFGILSCGATGAIISFVMEVYLNHSKFKLLTLGPFEVESHKIV